MFPFCDSPSPMDIPLYQQLQLTPPSPKPDHHHSTFFYYHHPPSSPSFPSFSSPAAAADTIGSPVMHPFMDLEQQQQPAAEDGAGGNNEYEQGVDAGAIGLDGAAAAAAARKDRHSKISTAGGMRDRRMRLSLDVARKFFALQDMLGFDKASKTVQWLLNMSKAAIREIMSDDASSVCEEDGSSSLSVDGKQHSNPAEGGAGDHKGAHSHSDGKKPAKPRRAAANPKPPRRLANAHPVPDKESRAKARERARERTKEKNRMRWVTLASAISVEAATAAAAAAAAAGEDKSPTSPSNNLNHSSSTNLVSTELEDGSSSTLHNGVCGGGRMQEISVASEPSDVIMAFANGGAYGDSSSYYLQQQHQQDQWELGGVVFANSRHYC
uniref:Teosinte branched 1 n=1 Tax=Oryza officinalis TaxID=4535 RepID=I0J1D0_9ORYZ|nr:teosinte branched 1 [Oryza officinalis]